MKEQILELFIADGRGSFSSSAEWRKRVTGTLICPHCHNVFESVGQMDAFVHNDERESDVDLIAGYCHGISPLSTHFIDVVGLHVLEKTAWLGRLFDEEGFEHIRYRAAIARRNNVIIRGRIKSHVGLCRECDRLLYWPIGAEYVIRQELPETPLFLSNGSIFCTPDFYEQRLSVAMLRHVSTRNISIRDEPLDGYPTSTQDLRAMLKAQGKLK